MNVGQIIIDLLTAILAGLVGFLIYKKMDGFYRLLFFQVIFYLCVDVIALNFQPNLWIYDLYVPIETLLIFLASAYILNTKNNKQILKLLFGVFIFIYSIELWYCIKNNNLVEISIVTEGLLVSAIFIYILYLQLSRKENTAINIPVVIISLGLVIYFAGTIPLLSSVAGLYLTDAKVVQQLFQNIVVNLSSLRYLLLAIGFTFLLYNMMLTKKRV